MNIHKWDFIDVVKDVCNNLPDIVKAVLFVSSITIFWIIVLV